MIRIISALILILCLSSGANAITIVSGDYNLWTAAARSDPGNQAFWSNLFDGQSVVTNENNASIAIEDYTTALPIITTINSNTLLNADWAVISTFRGGAFSEADIVNFVADGGSLWVNSENVGVSNSQTIIDANSLLNAVGSSMTINDDAIDGDFGASTNIFTDSLTAGVTSFTYAASATVSGGTPLIFSRTDPQSVIVAYESAASAPAPVPEPATIILLGTGLLGIGAAYRRKIRK